MLLFMLLVLAWLLLSVWQEWDSAATGYALILPLLVIVATLFYLVYLAHYFLYRWRPARAGEHWNSPPRMHQRLR